jgi:hypothetical protein
VAGVGGTHKCNEVIGGSVLNLLGPAAYQSASMAGAERVQHLLMKMDPYLLGQILGVGGG